MDENDPLAEVKWLQEQKQNLIEYLERENIKFEKVASTAEWHVAPYVSLWKIENTTLPEQKEWWGISGDLPTDYIPSKNIITPREAINTFANNWLEASSYMLKGEKPPFTTIGTPEEWPELGELLNSRAEILSDWVKDDELW